MRRVLDAVLDVVLAPLDWFVPVRDWLVDAFWQGWPWLFVVSGYVLGFVAIAGMWDPQPSGGEPPPSSGERSSTWWDVALFFWFVGYPGSVGLLWARAKERGKREEQASREWQEEQE